MVGIGSVAVLVGWLVKGQWQYWGGGGGGGGVRYV